MAVADDLIVRIHISYDFQVVVIVSDIEPQFRYALTGK